MRAHSQFASWLVRGFLTTVLVSCGGGDAPTQPHVGPSVKLGFMVQPSNVSAGIPINPAVHVIVQDAQGNVVTGSTASITVAITGGTGTAGAALSGTLAQTVVNGVGMFANLAVDRAGTGYTLTATSSTLMGATSSPFAISPLESGQDYVQLQSDAGDYIGAGQNHTYTQAAAVIAATATGGHLSIGIQGPQQWSGDFQVPDSLNQLQPGIYTGLQRYPFSDPAKGGLSWYGEGRGCNTLSGSFTIDSLTYNTSNLTAIDLRFEQHCEGGTPGLHGTIHWRSDDTTGPPGPVNPVPAGLWRPAPGATPSAGPYVYLNSDSGDYIGQGQIHTYTTANATIAVTANAGLLSVGINGVQSWSGGFQTMIPLSQVQPGYYSDLRRLPFNNPVKGGLGWSGEGRGCNTLLGWFAIDRVTYTNGTLSAVEMRFEQRCEGGTAALHGAVHWGG